MTAKIKLNAASGGGSISIQAPSSSSNNRVIALPDIADGTLVTSQSTLDATKLSGALPAISGANLTGISAGITMADMWRVNSAFTASNATDITSNWERVDFSAYDKIGSGMSESSGIFTFPSTGIYNVSFWTTVRGGGVTMYAGVQFHLTTDNNTYTNYADVYDSVSSSTYFSAISGQQIFDITNVSTHKLKFKVSSEQTATFQGDTTTTQLGATFIRLGDT
tara:strand:+ start:106 stop:771 length:666 start_codon:yes stop_codon:yes gene_type:complete